MEQNAEIECPHCRKRAVDYIYVGSQKDRIGYLLVWCNSCFKGTYISRVEAPENAKIITFEEFENMNLPVIELE